jgi:hypothetical protein
MEGIKYFFSYARKDPEFVLKLAKELRAVGVNLWLDQLDILGGQRWDRAVEGALQTCQGMIAVLSPDAIASHNVMDEVSYALEAGKLVVPILFHSCDIPFRLRRVQYIDFTAGYEMGFSRLLRALAIEQPSQPPEPSAPRERVVRDVTAPPEEIPKKVDTGVHANSTTKQSASRKLFSKLSSIHKAILGFLALLLLVLGLVFIFEKKEIIKPPTTPATEKTREEPGEQTIPSPSPGITKAMYDRIRTGMTYAEVISHLGRDGQELSRTEIAGFVTEIYFWKNEDNSEVMITLSNGKVMQKVQVGLR